ncbi:TonB family protein [Kamptonema cortianum]|nr:TonB family protein [Kamptonema cortianum]
MTIGTYGVSGGQESDFSAYFNHIRSRMIDSWDRPRDLLGPSQKLKTGIRMKISRNGNVSSVSLASSSGNSTWDESALAAARKVTKVNPLPDGLGDDSGLTLTVFFEPEG